MQRSLAGAVLDVDLGAVRGEPLYNVAVPVLGGNMYGVVAVLVIDAVGVGRGSDKDGDLLQGLRRESDCDVRKNLARLSSLGYSSFPPRNSSHLVPPDDGVYRLPVNIRTGSGGAAERGRDAVRSVEV